MYLVQSASGMLFAASNGFKSQVIPNRVNPCSIVK